MPQGVSQLALFRQVQSEQIKLGGHKVLQETILEGKGILKGDMMMIPQIH